MRVKITVETPLIIGGSDEMLEFDFSQESGRLKAIDMEATGLAIGDEDARKWQEHIMGLISLKGVPGRSLQKDIHGTGETKMSNLMTFYGSLASRGLLRTFANEIDTGVRDFWKYGGVTPTLHHIWEAKGKRFIEPYIPGSTVKGAIRRSLLFDLIRKGDALRSGTGDVKASDLILENGPRFDYRHAFEDSHVFALSGKYSPQNDIMRFITVSDFIPTGEFGLELVQLWRKSGSRDQKSNYIAATSGSFAGEISLSRSLITRAVGGKLSHDDYWNLSKVLNLAESDVENISRKDSSAFATVEERIVKRIIEKVTDYSVINGQNSGYDVEGRRGIIILGFGKGSPLTTVLNASSSFSAEAIRKMTPLLRGKNPRNIASPKTRWVVQGKRGESRPGLCRMEVIP